MEEPLVGEGAEYLKKQGITVTGLGDFNGPCPVATNPRKVPEADYLIVAVKTYRRESALADARHLRTTGRGDLARGRGMFGISRYIIGGTAFARRLPFERYFRDARAGMMMGLANAQACQTIAGLLFPQEQLGRVICGRL